MLKIEDCIHKMPVETTGNSSLLPLDKITVTWHMFVTVLGCPFVAQDVPEIRRVNLFLRYI
jgi:hypothetical protein